MDSRWANIRQQARIGSRTHEQDRWTNTRLDRRTNSKEPRELSWTVGLTRAGRLVSTCSNEVHSAESVDVVMDDEKVIDFTFLERLDKVSEAKKTGNAYEPENIGNAPEPEKLANATESEKIGNAPEPKSNAPKPFLDSGVGCLMLHWVLNAYKRWFLPRSLSI